MIPAFLFWFRNKNSFRLDKRSNSRIMTGPFVMVGFDRPVGRVVLATIDYFAMMAAHEIRAD